MQPILLTEFVAQTAVNYRGRRKSEKTISQFEQVVRELLAVGVTTTAELTDAAIIRWIDAWPDRTVETFNSHIRALSSLCKRAKRRGLVAENPFEVDAPSDWVHDNDRPHAERRRWSKPAYQIRAMLALAEKEARAGGWLAQRDYAYVSTLFLTGSRPGEIQRLRVCDYDRTARTLEIVAHWCTGRSGRRYWWKPKTKPSEGILAMGPRLSTILDAWLPIRSLGVRRGRLRVPPCEFIFPGEMGWGPWTAGPAGGRPLDRVKALGVRAGVDELTQKAARKGLGTYHDIGLTPEGRRRIFRHSDIATGEWYDEGDADSRRPDAIAIETFFFDAPEQQRGAQA